jgi:hypothetical protein
MSSPIGSEVDACLLWELREQYPTGHFDEINVAIDAVRRPALLDALGFLEPKIDRRRRTLSHHSTAAVKMWIDRIADRDIGGGLYLRRDGVGWCHVEVTS